MSPDSSTLFDRVPASKASTRSRKVCGQIGSDGQFWTIKVSSAGAAPLHAAGIMGSRELN